MTLAEFHSRWDTGNRCYRFRPRMGDFCLECRGHLSFPIVQAKASRGDATALVRELCRWLIWEGNEGPWRLQEAMRANFEASDYQDPRQPLRERFDCQTTAIVMCCLCAIAEGVSCQSEQSGGAEEVTVPGLREAIGGIAGCLRQAFPKLQDAITLGARDRLPQLYREDLKDAELSPWLVLAADLVQDIRSAHDGVLQPVGTAETPVLFAHDSIASVLMLRVELLNDGFEGILPSLSSLGSILLDDDLCQSTIDVWKASKVSGRRIVWSLRPYTRLDADRIGNRIDLMTLGGRSMEAALLAAIWAANGGIPGDKDFQMPTSCRMERARAVTAAIVLETEHGEGGNGLREVEHTDQKLEAARRAQLDEVLICAPSAGSPTEKAEAALKNEVAERQKWIVSGSVTQRDEALAYPGLTVTRVQTARDVFDGLLVENRYLVRWQKSVRDNWLARWEARPTLEDGTRGPGARAPGDTDYGPDDDNIPGTPEGHADGDG